MNDVWQQFTRSKLERESTKIRKRLFWLLTLQPLFLAGFFILHNGLSGTEYAIDSRMMNGLAFLFPVLGIMVSTSMLIANFIAYMGVYRVFADENGNIVVRDFETQVKSNAASVRSLIVSSGVTLLIFFVWIGLLSTMTCAYQLNVGHQVFVGYPTAALPSTA